MGYTYVSDGHGGTDRPRTPTGDGYAIDHTGENTPRGYGTAASNSILTGMSVYPKAGATVIYFSDSAGTKQVGPSGGNGGQDKSPSRTGNSLVGFTTGKTNTDYVEVSWVNRWWQDAYFKFFPHPGEWKSESKISWVRKSSVDIVSEYQTEAERAAELVLQEQNELLKPPPTSTGIDSTTLGIVAVGAALLIKKKKRKK